MKLIDNIPVVETSLDTGFSFDVFRPETLRTITGLTFTRQHIAFLLSGQLVNMRYDQLDMGHKWFYFPVLFLYQFGIRTPISGDDILDTPYDCLDRSGHYIRLPKRQPSGDILYFWYPIEERMATRIKDLQKSFSSREYLFDYLLSDDASKTRDTSLKEIFATSIYAVAASGYRYEKGLSSFMKKTYALDNADWLNPELYSSDEMQQYFIPAWQLSVENLLLMNPRTDITNEINWYLYGTRN